MTTHAIQAVAIDLDGTLVDSVKDLHAAIVMMQTRLNEPAASVGDVRQWVGNGIERLVHRALTRDPHTDADHAIFATALDAFKSAYTECNGKYSTLYPGVKSTLDWLNAKHQPMAVVTNKARAFTLPLIQQLSIDGYFSMVIAGDDVDHKKPAPDALLKLSHKYQADPSRCVLIGDSKADFQAAKAAGFLSVGVTYGYHQGTPIQQLPKADQPDIMIDQFSELVDCWSKL